MPKSVLDEKFLTIKHVAEKLDVSDRTVYRLAAEGQLRCLKIRSALRVLESSFQSYLQRQIEIYDTEVGRREVEDDFS